MAEVTLTVAAETLGISKQALHKHRKLGHITARKVGGIYLVDEDTVRKELDKYLNRPGQKYVSKFSPKEAPSESSPDSEEQSKQQNNDQTSKESNIASSE